MRMMWNFNSLEWTFWVVECNCRGLSVRAALQRNECTVKIDRAEPVMVLMVS